MPASIRIWRIGRSWDFWWPRNLVAFLSTRQIRKTNRTGERGNKFMSSLKYPRKCDYVRVVNRLVANADAQNDVIHCERIPPKTSFCVTCCAVYVAANPFTSEKSSIISVTPKHVADEHPVANQSSTGKIMMSLDCHTT
jgi:hypothetical protein